MLTNIPDYTAYYIPSQPFEFIKVTTPANDPTTVFIPSVFAISGVTGQQAPITQTFY
jgi:hypothetical protein